MTEEEGPQQLQECSFFATLPPEIYAHILSFLSIQELCTVSLVSTLWRRIANDRVLWKGAYRRHELTFVKILKEADESLFYYDKESGSVNWKRAYQYAITLQQNWLRSTCKEKMRIPTKSPAYVVRFDSQQVVVGCRDGRIKFFERGTGIRTRGELLGHTAWIGSIQYDKEKIVSCSGDQSLRVWNWEGECTKCITYECWVKRLQYDDKILVTAGGDGLVRIHTWENLDEVAMELSGHTAGLMALHYDTQHYFSGSLDATVRIWDKNTGVCLSVLQNVGKSKATPPGVRCLWHNPKIIMAGGDQNRVTLWDRVSCNAIKTFKAHKGKVKQVYFDGYKVITAGEDGNINLWDNRGTLQEPIVKIAAHMRDIIHMDVQDAALMSASLDKSVKEFSVL